MYITLKKSAIAWEDVKTDEFPTKVNEKINMK